MNRDTAWLVIYASLVSIVNHPRNKDVPRACTLGDRADYYLKEFERRFPWPDSSQGASQQQDSSET